MYFAIFALLYFVAPLSFFRDILERK